MFDPFKFLEERKAGLAISELDKDEFQLFNVVQAMSMDYRYRRLTAMVNDISFSHLPKDIQALSMRSLNNVNIDTKWHRARSSSIKNREETVQKIMTMLNMSHSSVEAAMKYNLIDVDAVLYAWTRRYEPEKLLDSKAAKNK